MRLRLPVREIAAGLLDAIAPPRCMGCLKEGTYFCTACRTRMRFSFPLVCAGCGKESLRGLTCRQCSRNCRLNGLVTLGGYQAEWLRRGIHWLKFRSVRDVAAPLAQLLLPLLPVIAPIGQLQVQAVIVPIPLYPRREQERGFNQSEEMAQRVAKATGIAAVNILRRQRATWAQSKLPLELKRENMRGAFVRSVELPRDKQIFIILDDVTTSGATLEAAAQVLEAPPQAQVWGMTLARG